MRVHHSPLLRSLQKISGILLAGGFLFGTFLLFPVQSRGATPERTTPGVRPVPDSVLAGMRGGFSWGGINFSFGIESSTFVNGALMVKTILQTVGNELLVETGSNPFQSSTGNGSPQVSATVSASTASVSKTVSNNVLNSNSGGSQQATNTISSPSLTVSSSSSSPPLGHDPVRSGWQRFPDRQRLQLRGPDRTVRFGEHCQEPCFPFGV